jgi:hypothetical protein
MKVSELKTEMDGRFAATAQQLVSLTASNATDHVRFDRPARRPRPSPRENREGPQRRS